MNVAEVEYFLRDEDQKNARRPLVRRAAERRLEQLDRALGDRTWLVGSSFTVRKIATAYRKAVEDQTATIAAHAMAEMKYDQVESENVQGRRSGNQRPVGPSWRGALPQYFCDRLRRRQGRVRVSAWRREHIIAGVTTSGGFRLVTRGLHDQSSFSISDLSGIIVHRRPS